MSRFKVLRANPRRALAALATLLVAVGVTGASGADFTATSANPGNTFAVRHARRCATRKRRRRRSSPSSGHDARRPARPATVDIKNTGIAQRRVHALAQRTLIDSRRRATRCPAKLNLRRRRDCGADLDCARRRRRRHQVHRHRSPRWAPTITLGTYVGRATRAPLRVHGRRSTATRRQRLPGRQLDASSSPGTPS